MAVRFENILIDIGWVLVHYDVPSFHDFVVRNNGTIEADQSYFKKRKGLFDAGKISEENFWRVYKEEVGVTATPEQIMLALRKTVKVDWELLSLVKGLRESGMNVFIVSNIDETTLRFVQKEIDFTLFDGAFISCKMKILKGDTHFFEKVISETGIDSSKTLLIDDEERNIDSARKQGIEGHLYLNLNELTSFLGE